LKIPNIWNVTPLLPIYARFYYSKCLGFPSRFLVHAVLETG